MESVALSVPIRLDSPPTSRQAVQEEPPDAGAAEVGAAVEGSIFTFEVRLNTFNHSRDLQQVAVITAASRSENTLRM